MIRTLIIDDEPLIRENTETVLAMHQDVVVVGQGGSVAEGLLLLKATKPDLVLLDIQLGDGTGFDILEQTEQKGFSVVFLTAYNDRGIRAIKAGALDYLLKPLDEDELSQALGRVRALQAATRPHGQIQLAQQYFSPQGIVDRIALREQSAVHIVPFADILYAQSDRSYTHFYLSEGRMLTLSSPLKDYEEILPEKHFIRVHNSYLVNRAMVSKYDKSGILHLVNGAEIPVAVRKREDVLRYLVGNR
ncbi:MAG: response regulator transcription factor [Bacteroidetes bacterium]|nr:response regulator transcription factor [Bacteroidota bacterium]